jgi:hypothetical protein
MVVWEHFEELWILGDGYVLLLSDLLTGQNTATLSACL